MFGETAATSKPWAAQTITLEVEAVGADGKGTGKWRNVEVMHPRTRGYARGAGGGGIETARCICSMSRGCP
jgi:hypothetical protein